MEMTPAVAVSRPAIRRSVVDLPQPDGPSSARSPPGSAEKLTASTAGPAPQDFVTPWSCTLATFMSRLQVRLRALRRMLLPMVFQGWCFRHYEERLRG